MLTANSQTVKPTTESIRLFKAALRLVTSVPGAEATKYRPPKYMGLYYAQVWPATAKQTVDLPFYVKGAHASVWFEAVSKQLAQNMGQHVLNWLQLARRVTRASLSCAFQQAWL